MASEPVNCACKSVPGVCSENLCCDHDPLATLVAGYKVMAQEDFERGFESLSSLGDCVAGAHNGQYSLHAPIRRHGHQYCLSRESIVNLKDLLEANFSFEDFGDFETLYSRTAEIFEKLKSTNSAQGKKNDSGALHLYDTALRIAMVFYPKDRNVHPGKMVYIQAGAYIGAISLQKISMLCRKELEIRTAYMKSAGLKISRPLKPRYRACYLSPDIKIRHGGSIPVSSFNCHMQSLGSMHIENFLCIYHRLLEDWATGYGNYVEKLKEKLNKKVRELV